jgi:ATP-binding cassette subfamily B protein
MAHDLIKSPHRYLFKVHKERVALGVFTLLITNVLDALPPYFIGITIDQIARGDQMRSIAKTIGIIFLITAALMVTRYLWRIFWGAFSHMSCEEVQNRIFKQFTLLSLSDLRRHPAGELMSLIINDVQSFRMGIGPGVIIFADAFFILLIIPGLMYSLSPSWTWKTLLIMLLLPFVAHFLTKRLFAAYEKRQERFAELSGKAQEIVSGIRVIKSFVKEDAQTFKFNNYSKRFETACNESAYFDAWFTPAMEGAVSIGRVILIIVGAYDVISGQVTIGTFFAFYQYIQRMEWPATAIGYGLSHLQQGGAAFSRIREFLKLPSDPAYLGKKELSDFRSLEVINLSFNYESKIEPALKNINFMLNQGETLCIIGPIGSGKSTLIDILSHLLPYHEGVIRINGERLENIKLESLRKIMSVVPQEPFLFSDSIEANLALGTKLSNERVQDLLKSVDMTSEVNSLPQKEKSELGERGVNLSGGQKQRLTLARALGRQSPLLIIDDAMSAIDSQTEKEILSTLKKHFAKSNSVKPTLILVTQRIDSAKWADKILVLNNGEQEALGTHPELLLNSPTYKKLFEIQNKGASSERTVH